MTSAQQQPDYGQIVDQAHALGMFISAQMELLDHMTDDRWKELHDLAKMADAVFCTAGRLERREAEAAQFLAAAAAHIAAEVSPGQRVMTDEWSAAYLAQPGPAGE